MYLGIRYHLYFIGEKNYCGSGGLLSTESISQSPMFRLFRDALGIWFMLTDDDTGSHRAQLVENYLESADPCHID
ncbi:hypothetical protein TNCV_5050111 [Trichonephila clavipes]|nr:hypothetical protein TNCV_5050111 [Trichonephila clavipes]